MRYWSLAALQNQLTNKTSVCVSVYVYTHTNYNCCDENGTRKRLYFSTDVKMNKMVSNIPLLTRFSIFLKCDVL